MKPVDNCPSGKRALNKEKNRYRNVLPCEFIMTDALVNCQLRHGL